MNPFERLAIAGVMVLGLAACAHDAPAEKRSKMIEVESQDMISATLMATFKCMDDPDVSGEGKTTGVRLVADNGTKKTFECFEGNE